METSECPTYAEETTLLFFLSYWCVDLTSTSIVGCERFNLSNFLLITTLFSHFILLKTFADRNNREKGANEITLFGVVLPLLLLLVA